MLAAHSWKTLSIEKQVDDSVGFLLTNKKGGYTSLTFPNISRYNGFFVFEDGEMFKVLDSVMVKDAGKVKQVSNHFYSVDVGFENAKQSFFVPSDTNSLVVEFDKEKEIELLFDIKKSYDNSDMGREYAADIRAGSAVIRYVKKKGNTSDYEFFVVIKCVGEIKKNDVWIKKDYSLDRKRNSSPFERYVYSALKLKTKKLVITAYSDRKKAEKECSSVFLSAVNLFDKEKKELDNFDFPKKVPLNVGFAYLSCCNSVRGLANSKTFFAGLPWFFQRWSRDSAISVKALIDLGEFRLAKTVLFELLSSIDYDGNINSKIGDSADKGIPSADALGWTCLRFSQLISALKNKDMVRRYISAKEEAALIDKVEHALLLAVKFKTKDGFAVNGAKETWMDTNFGDDNRSGVRLEIQALRLALYRLAFELTGKKEFKDLEEQLKLLIYKNFWNLKYLGDGLNDFTVRPNVFLAAYIFPDFLVDEKWVSCFDYVIPELWLDWGGFSTIEKNHRLFCSEYTGEDNKSYHRGDSWFWLNNYAAVVLKRFDGQKFSRYIDKIAEASCEEILWKGMVGCHSEVSSAKELRSEGCWSQLWSSASFIELVNRVYLGR